MTSTNINLPLVCYLLLTIVHSLVGDGPVCIYGRGAGYISADCRDQKLQDVPKNLKSDIEALDLSDNMIRGLRNDSFTCCTSIKILYLSNNAIFEIDSHTFYPLTNLIFLDLSRNVLSELPENLPSSLEHLFLSENPRIFTSSNGDWPELKITSLTSLQVLRLASNTRRLTKFPKFGGNVPNLIELNITDNEISSITPEDLAPVCQLKFLLVSPLFKRPEQLCDCLKFEKWISKYEIQVKNFTCGSNKVVKGCDVEPKNSTLAVREKCLAELSARKLPFKLMVGSGVVALILCICILLYIRHRRRAREKSKTVSGQNSRTPSVKFDSKTLEENNERAPVEEDKLLKQ